MNSEYQTPPSRPSRIKLSKNALDTTFIMEANLMSLDQTVRKTISLICLLEMPW